MNFWSMFIFYQYVLNNRMLPGIYSSHSAEEICPQVGNEEMLEWYFLLLNTSPLVSGITSETS